MMTRAKHVWNFGRWRIAWRLGPYRPGFCRRDAGHFTGALPFLWFNAIRRNQVGESER